MSEIRDAIPAKVQQHRPPKCAKCDDTGVCGGVPDWPDGKIDDGQTFSVCECREKAMSEHKDIDEAESLMGSQIREYGEWVNVGTIRTTNILALLRELRDRREADRWIPIAEATPIMHSTYWVAYPYDYDSTIHRELAVWCVGGFRSIDTNRDWDYSRVTHVIPLRIPSPPESEPTK